jgi:hypothetical protein
MTAYDRTPNVQMFGHGALAIELGNNTDTTLGRTSGGIGNIEGKDIVLDGAGQSPALTSVLLSEQSTPPSTPASGFNRLWAEASGLIISKDDSGRHRIIGESCSRQLYSAGINGNSAPSNFGQGSPTAEGTNTGISATGTNFFTRSWRIENDSAASAASGFGWRWGDPMYLADAGYRCIRFGFEDFQANCAAFIGIKPSAAHGDVDPSSFVNCIGVGIDAGQTTWHLLNNDSSGSATSADLGSNFPANTDATDLYELLIWWPAGGAVVNVQLTRLNTGHVSFTQISTNLPASTVALNTHACGNTRAGTSAVKFSFSQMRGATV